MDIVTNINPAGEWYAIDRNSCDQDGFFSTSQVGYGKTEQAAIADLLDQIEELAQ